MTEAKPLNRRFLLRQRPQGDYDPKVLERVVEPVPVPGPGQALVRNLYLSLDPAMRGWMSDAPSYIPPVQIGEAVRIGPFLMPRFAAPVLSAYDVDSIARYVLHARHPTDIGGWGIGHIGPVPEGMVAWFIALVALVAVARLIGERGET